SRTATLGPGHFQTLYSKINLAGLYRSQNKLNQSIPLLEETFRTAKLHPDCPDSLTLGAQADLAANYLDAGRFADEIPLLEEVHRNCRDYPELALVIDSLRAAYERAGKAAKTAESRVKPEADRKKSEVRNQECGTGSSLTPDR